MGVVCPSCDHEPPAEATAGTACPACGERLMVIAVQNLVGEVIDRRFEILGMLGKGGMGEVYRAKQLSIGREVALKVLDRRVEGDVAAVKRFFREAKLASTLAHPNTVPIIDFGQNADGRLYLVMELVVGHTLLDELTRIGAMPLDRVVAIGTQLCDALEVAHEKAIVHRDLKLENIMLLDGKRDLVKVLDFGLARSIEDHSLRATATGLVSGTPRYMPPEVAYDAAPPDPSQDMYAVGVILAELAMGRPLFVAPTVEALFTKKLDLDTVLVDVPAAIEPLVRRLVSPEPADRLTASATREALQSALHAPPTVQSLQALQTFASLQMSAFARKPTPRPPAPVAFTDLAYENTSDIAFPDLSKASLVDLDQRDGAAPTPPAPATTPPPDAVAPQVSPDKFQAPATPEPALELDDSFGRGRSQKLPRAAEPVAIVALPPRTTQPGSILTFLVLLAVGAVGLYFLMRFL